MSSLLSFAGCTWIRLNFQGTWWWQLKALNVKAALLNDLCMICCPISSFQKTRGVSPILTGLCGPYRGAWCERDFSWNVAQGVSAFWREMHIDVWVGLRSVGDGHWQAPLSSSRPSGLWGAVTRSGPILAPWRLAAEKQPGKQQGIHE